MPPEGVVFLTAMSIVGRCVLLYPLIRALAERIRGGGPGGGGMRDELQGFRDDVLHAAQQTHRQLGALSERSVLLRRLIAKQQEAERPPPARRPRTAPRSCPS